MDITDIAYLRELAALMRANGLARLSVSAGEAKAELEAAGAPASGQGGPPPETEAAADTGAGAGAFSPGPANAAAEKAAYEVKAPLVGVYYSAPSPEAEPFVCIGDSVKQGDILCIIEAMKLMNEITAEADGKIADICLKNGDLVEFGQVMLRIEPEAAR